MWNRMPLRWRGGRRSICRDGRRSGGGTGTRADRHQRRVHAKAAFALLADPNQPWRWRMPWEMLDLYWVDERSVPPATPRAITA